MNEHSEQKLRGRPMWSVIFVPHWGQNFFAISGKSSNCMIWRNSFARFGGR